MNKRRALRRFLRHILPTLTEPDENYLGPIDVVCEHCGAQLLNPAHFAAPVARSSYPLYRLRLLVMAFSQTKSFVRILADTTARLPSPPHV